MYVSVIHGKYLKRAGRVVSTNIKLHHFIFMLLHKIGFHVVQWMLETSPNGLLLFPSFTYSLQPLHVVKLPMEGLRIFWRWWTWSMQCVQSTAGSCCCGQGRTWTSLTWPLTEKLPQLHLQSVHCKITREIRVWCMLCNRRVQQKLS